MFFYKGQKMTSTKRHDRTTAVTIALFFAIILLAATAMCSDVLAAGKVTAFGKLMSIENDGTVIINEKGYLVSSPVAVRNGEGRRIELRDLQPETIVLFEYEQTTKGFVIIYIKEIPQ